MRDHKSAGGKATCVARRSGTLHGLRAGESEPTTGST
jgi:hypothetical protein